VLLLENIHQSAVDFFEKDPNFSVDKRKSALTGDDLKQALAHVHILGIRSKTRITADVLDAAPNLLTIGCFCIGTNQVALKEAAARGVPVFNAPFSNTRSVAELVLGELIALARKLADRSKDMHNGFWNKSAAGCSELRGKTVGIVGFGHIGSQLSVLAEGLGMVVKYYDVKAVQRIGNAAACKSLGELLQESHFVTLHVPESAETKGLIGAKEITQMKDGSYLINASRGTVVDLDAVARALKSGKLAGAAVDVFPVEPSANGPGFETPLTGLNNVILTPHVAGSTLEAQISIGEEVAGVLRKYVQFGATVGSVNFPELDARITSGAHRIINIHHNQPGVLGAINGIIADSNINVHLQMLATNPEIGFLILDINKEASVNTVKEINALQYSIASRILN